MKPSIPSNHEVPRSPKPQLVRETHIWWSHHTYVLLSSLGQLVRAPLPTIMTIVMIGIVLALPAGLYLLLENIQRISHDWGGTTQISLFLKPEIDEAKVHALTDRLLARTEISNVQIITPAEALEEYRSLSGFKDALMALESNPLPYVLVLQLSNGDITAQDNQLLVEQLNRVPEVDLAQFDMLWLKRLFAMIEVVRRGVFILATLLSLAVILVIGNTIRLSLYNRREEIEVYKLVGATDAFIRRPFLYSGLWYGLLGGSVAWGLVDISFWLLQGPVKNLTFLYNNPFKLITLNSEMSITLLLISALLGLGGSWLAVGQHLKEIQPR